MGFGGVAEMITSLKNNSRQKTLTTNFKRSFSKNYKSTSIQSKPISKEALVKIKTHVTTEEKTELKRSFLLFSIVMACIISLLIFFMF